MLLLRFEGSGALSGFLEILRGVTGHDRPTASKLKKTFGEPSLNLGSGFQGLFPQQLCLCC